MTRTPVPHYCQVKPEKKAEPNHRAARLKKRTVHRRSKPVPRAAKYAAEAKVNKNPVLHYCKVRPEKWTKPKYKAAKLNRWTIDPEKKPRAKLNKILKSLTPK